MENIFTHEDLFVRHLYGETGLDEDVQIAHLLETNWEAKETFEELQNAYDLLNTVKDKSPSRTSLEIILKYSKNIRQPEVIY